MRKLFTILIVSLATISCGKIRDAHNTLDDIETFINECPDSALTFLDSFDTTLLENKSVLAHHSLLHAQAKDKCYIDETNDSLMTQVVNYYESKHDKEKLFKSYYYLGRIQYNAGNYAESMLSYTKAEQHINEIDDDFIKGLLYAQLGILHQKYYDYHRSLEAYKTSHEYYTAAGMTAHQYTAKLNIGQVFQELEEYALAEDILLDVLDWSYETEHHRICEEAFEFLLTLYEDTAQTDKSLELINSKYGARFGSSLQVIQIRAYELALQHSKTSLDLIKDAERHLEYAVDSISNYFYKYCILKQFGRYEEALECHEQMIQLQDEKTWSALQQPLLSAKNTYLETENKYMHLKIKMRQYQMVGIILILAVSVYFIITYYRRKIRDKNLEMMNYIEVASDLEQTLINKHQEIETIKKDLGIIDSELRTCEGYIAEMFYKQYELLNKLTGTYYETHVCNKDMETIYKQVSQEIERLSSDKKYIGQLENFVNRYKRNIMHTIRTSIPELTEMEYRLLCYFSAGFSAKAISVFTGDSTNNIYVKKSRLKNIIIKLEDDNIKREILETITIK